MPIETNCPHCHASYRLADEVDGKTVRCKQCSTTFAVMAAARPAAPPRSGMTSSRAPAGGRGERPLARDDRDYEDRRPRRRLPDDGRDEEDRHDFRLPRRGRAGMPLWIWFLLGGVGLLFVVGGVIAVVLLLGNSGSFTEANFDKLKVGMTEGDLHAILGTPARVDDPAAAFGAFGVRNEAVWLMPKVLEYERGDDVATVTLVGDRLQSCGALFGDHLRSLSENALVPVLPKVRGKDTDFNKVRPGMTEVEVLRLLGSPMQCEVVGEVWFWHNGINLQEVKRPDGTAKTIRKYSYNSAFKQETVLFTDGQVYKRNGQPGDFPVVQPPIFQPPVIKPPDFPGPFGPPKETDFNKVRIGMTEAEVINLFGEPLKKENLDTIWFWHNGLTVRELKRPDGSLKAVRKLTYAIFGRGLETIILVEGRVYKRNGKPG